MAFLLPEVVATHFHVRPGDVVADLGAGSGHFARILSRLTGDKGKVFAVEIQKQLAETLAGIARSERLLNVDVVWGDLEALNGTKITDHSVDIALLINTLSMLDDKATAIQEMSRILKVGGKAIIVDWTDSFGGLGPQPHMVVGEAAARALFEAQGCVYERSFPAGDHHYGISLRKT